MRTAQWHKLIICISFLPIIWVCKLNTFLYSYKIPPWCSVSLKSDPGRLAAVKIWPHSCSLLPTDTTMIFMGNICRLASLTSGLFLDL